MCTDNKVTSKSIRKHVGRPQKHIPCAVCGKHSLITECHHAVSLKECAGLLNMGFAYELKVPLVWLCPNCHTYAHLIFDRNSRTMDILESIDNGSITREEFSAFKNIQDMRNDFYSRIFEHVRSEE